jgi:predicted transcriptional regulator
MIGNTIVALNDSHIVIPLLQNIVDETAFKIILSTIDSAKTVFQLCNENKIPISSAYKKMRKLQSDGIVSVEKIEIDDNGRKVLFYKSNIKTLDFNLRKDGILLQFNK